MHKQLVLLHNAVSAYFSGNAAALEGTIKQFNVKVNYEIWSSNDSSNIDKYYVFDSAAEIAKQCDRFMARKINSGDSAMPNVKTLSENL